MATTDNAPPRQNGAGISPPGWGNVDAPRPGSWPNLERSAEPKQRLGLLVSGSIAGGLEARLDAHSSVEDIRLGKFVKIVGEKYEYFCLVSDVKLESANPDVLRDPPGGPGVADQLLREVLAGTTTYGIVKLKPELMLGKDALGPDDPEGIPRPARTVPPHFSAVFDATEGDFERVFGAEDNEHFQIGRPIDMDIPVCISLKKLVERSNGVFGKSGTGKSFLTRLILAGTIKANAAVNLVFDMHSEYGWNATHEGGAGAEVKGLSQLFPGRVLVYTLDPESARARNVRPDGVIKLGLDEITMEDITLLEEELKLNRTATESAVLCVDRFQEKWVSKLLDMDNDALRDFAEANGGNYHSLSALRSKVRVVAARPFIEKGSQHSRLEELVAALEAGKHVVLEFGRQAKLLDYLLVSNVITRRLHEVWVKKTEQYLNTKNEADKPRQLMITIEEAHKFLNSEAASQTSFGTIARELRKFFVTLLVVDQRPSGIDSEVLSQIGTRITCQLNDDKDIDAIFTGVSGASHLRSVLATLDSREQALVLGHAVPMAVMIRTRKYDTAFYGAMGGTFATPETVSAKAREYDEIFGSDD